MYAGRLFRSLVLSFFTLGFLSAGQVRPQDRRDNPAADAKVEQNLLVIHEWGTFTSLQDEGGRSIQGINTDDEPLPKFVHRLADFLIPEPTDLAPVFYKGLPQQHRDVRMRLETPVLYFHPPAEATLPISLDLEVGFRGGWITEYYPNADVASPNVRTDGFDFGPIRPDAFGRIRWRGLKVGGGSTAAETDARVWLAPRNVEAAMVQNPAGEAEHYLFYRGVGNIQAPLRVLRDEKNENLVIAERDDLSTALEQQLPLRALWLAHIRPDGAVAYRSLGGATISPTRDRVLKTTPAGFADADFSAENLPRLRAEMKKSLIADGLFADEAEAMLETWEAAYFQSPGLRLFFLLPQAWTDYLLPLEVSRPAKIVRTMVGRIELLTPRHRKLLGQIADSPRSELNWVHEQVGKTLTPEQFSLLAQGRLRMRELEKLNVPADYQAYVDLGRFRNAIILDRLDRQPPHGLAAFADTYGLEYFRPQGEPGGQAILDAPRQAD